MTVTDEIVKIANFDPYDVNWITNIMFII